MANTIQLIGSCNELTCLYELASVTGVRSLLFVTGPSGIGKTTLARA